MSAPKLLRLADYKKPPFTTGEVNLNFDVHEDHTIVTSKAVYHRTPEWNGEINLVLDTKNPNPEGSPDYLRAVKINGQTLSEFGYTYDKENKELRIPVDLTEDNIEVEI